MISHYTTILKLDNYTLEVKFKKERSKMKKKLLSSLSSYFIKKKKNDSIHNKFENRVGLCPKI